MFKIYIDPEVQKFILNLEPVTKAKIARNLDLLENFGYKLEMPHSKKISDTLFELRIRGQQEIRIFYCFHNEVIKLLHGFTKKSQKIPLKELRAAENKYKALTQYNL
ncbi:MAG: hypothetical protein A3C49_03050 [Candidatus Doudnabacteria bacterium RIFCSPHIGHO2_02_FULL_42_25]|uniref:Addiction module toxin RelE n=1 Tax=Candidatus Doudnabacteria bacterium RIFCSPHIGHO2_01_FULL_41_86 TaxID=1817821 RepID=A0A1F5NA10_9BACT|nr:MAG: hypothetical protein A2717_02645 [Candidatus Doudnabacteria bacterium RIFCSPHIGHO2_01_FULL_41_86]OGE75490.1 MAG: hypothetical protein A3K07_00975 [Candidatus Doudnabacteria bacterium RIFCSPHIGHO2_01_43_10]OGE85447.1 MAG: hypothetical protein A3E28_02215 [Candidatus Doudnabacteria bacterium RIFCSPHIGHO2_12_FULL_42_22]OGE86985.1 MAG: hypothetical protein A3C49_03050 [Candidatus Doudnabacteria bacterium RIFCSPHIGHO2_02_FULL_42_25]OGE92584.1 MAG: hypothetical protein A2895_03205 [Candidatus